MTPSREESVIAGCTLYYLPKNHLQFSVCKLIANYRLPLYLTYGQVIRKPYGFRYNIFADKTDRNTISRCNALYNREAICLSARRI